MQSGTPDTVEKIGDRLCSFHRKNGEQAVRTQGVNGGGSSEIKSGAERPAPTSSPRLRASETSSSEPKPQAAAIHRPPPPRLTTDQRPEHPAPPMVEVDSSEEGRAILERVRIAISNATYEVVDVRRIRPMKGQPRTYFNKERLLKLAGSIKTVGQITPGYLREVEPDAEGRDRELVDGERRWQSILMAGIPTFRAMLVRIDDAAAQYIVSVIANFNREGHTVLEIAESIKVMHEDLKLGMQEIGDSIGFHPVYTANLYGLRRLTKTVRDMLDPEIQRDHNRQLPVTAAIEISRLPAERQEPLAWRILNRELNLRGLRKEVAQILEESGTPIQRRTQDPSNQRKTLEKKITGLRREAKDLRSRLEETPVSVLKGFGGMVADHCSTLESTKIDIDASLAVFGQVSQRT